MAFGISERMEVILAVVLYSLCSGSLVLVNKLILHSMPFPSLVITIQLVSCVCMLYSASMFGIIKVDKIKWVYLKPYMFYTIAFSTGVYCNMKSLSMSNVETVIVFRALAPLVVSITEAAFLGRELPSMRSLTALCVIVIGAMGYANTDEKFRTQGTAAYVWPFFYLLAISGEMVYGKKIVKDVKFETSTGPVQYTNLLGWPPCLLFAAISGEFQTLGRAVLVEGGGTFYGYLASLSTLTVALTIAGCIIGTGIGYTSWWCRDKVSATSFTLIGVMNKCFTILVNCLIWDNHATPTGILFLSLCIVGGVFYQQAPMKNQDVESKPLPEDEEALLHDSSNITKAT
jgi:solute carrier family 35 protein